jgi:hypothetical protein
MYGRRMQGHACARNTRRTRWTRRSWTCRSTHRTLQGSSYTSTHAHTYTHHGDLPQRLRRPARRLGRASGMRHFAPSALHPHGRIRRSQALHHIYLHIRHAHTRAQHPTRGAHAPHAHANLQPARPPRTPRAAPHAAHAHVPPRVGCAVAPPHTQLHPAQRTPRRQTRARRAAPHPNLPHPARSVRHTHTHCTHTAIPHPTLHHTPTRLCNERMLACGFLDRAASTDPVSRRGGR